MYLLDLLPFVNNRVINNKKSLNVISRRSKHRYSNQLLRTTAYEFPLNKSTYYKQSLW